MKVPRIFRMFRIFAAFSRGGSGSVHVNTAARIALVAIAGIGLGRSRAYGQASLPVDPGEVVHTFGAPNDLGDPVVNLLDVRNPVGQGAMTNTNWNPPRYWNAGGGINAWTASNLGAVYGVTLDGATNPNIYVSATIFLGPSLGPLGAGGVYRLDGTTGQICHLATIPSDASSSLGNISYSAASNSLYVSNFADGMIYRLWLGPSASTPLCPVTVPMVGGPSVWDHGVSGRASISLPTIPDDGQPGFTQYGRRVWGLAKNPAENRLYYGVWWEDSGTQNPTERNEIWSVGLDTAGDFVTGSAVREFAVPDLASFNHSNPCAGISFEPSSGAMLVSERTVGTAHRSRLLEYSGSTGAWAAAPINKYKVGLGDTSCTGTSVADCDGNVWSVGDGVIFGGVPPVVYVYGMVRIPAGGNAADVPATLNSYCVDTDAETTQQDKFTIGCVAIRNQCDCSIINDTTILCEVSDTQPPMLTGNYTYTFTFTNHSGQPIQYLFFPPSSGIVPLSIALPTPVPDGGMSGPITVTITGQHPGHYCFNVTFANPEIEACCQIEHCIDIPECRCEQFPRFDVACDPATGAYSITFTVQNFNAGPINELHIFPQPIGSGVTATPADFYFPNVPPFGVAGPFTTTISGAMPGPLCLRISVHLNGTECCSLVHCVTLPDCHSDWHPCPADFNHDGVANSADFFDFLNAFFTGNPAADFNNSGSVNSQDFFDFLVAFFAGCP